MSSSSSSSSSNYHPQQRHYFLAPDGSKLLRGQHNQQQVATNPQTTTMPGAANGLPPMPTSSTSATLEELSQQRSLARQQHQLNSNNNNHHHHHHHHHNHQHQSKGRSQSSQASQQQHQQQQARNFYGPIESVTMQQHMANINSTHHRQQDQPIVFAADRQSAAIASGQQQHHSMASTSMDRRQDKHASQSRDVEHSFSTSTVRSRTEQSHYSDGLHQHQQQHQHQHQQSALHHRPSVSSNNNKHPNHHHHNQHANQAQPANHERGGFGSMTDCPCDRNERLDEHEDDQLDQARSARLEHEQDQYANQLRRSQLQQRIGNLHPQHSQQQQPATSFHGFKTASSPRQMQANQQQQQQQQHQAQKSQQQMTSSSNDAKNTQHSQQQARDSLHVNFNRSSQRGANEADDDESGESTRKKKYLTAKYGQQQMNLIKKRLKIEMWLHDQLQELAKLSKSVEQEELDDIDIDLDQLLDMDDDATRRNWLRKTLEPLNDLPGESLEKFIDDVLEQSKLL